MKKLSLLVVIVLTTVHVFADDSITKAPSVKEIFMQGISLNYLIAALGWASWGVAISLLIHANYRDQNSPNTPEPFKPLFLLKDNWKRILLAYMLIIVFLVFTKEIIGKELTMFWALVIGLGWDQLAGYLKSKSDILKVARPEQTPV